MLSRKNSFREQVGAPIQRGTRASKKMVLTDEERLVLTKEIAEVWEDGRSPFVSKFAPSDMRQLALVAHNHMKPAMKDFIQAHSEILKKFRITGTQTTMRMCKTLWGEDDPDIEYGLTCTSGPLGGDAQIAALMCMEDLGALIFFVDPLSAHPHQADIDSLIRLANCGNVILCPNPTSAISMMHTLRIALESGRRGMMPSFFETLESPAVEEYKYQQELALATAVGGKPGGPLVPAGASTDHPAVRPALGVDPSMCFAITANEADEEDDEKSVETFDVMDAIEEMQSFNFGEESEEVPGQGSRLGRSASNAVNLYGVKITEKKKKGNMLKKIHKSMKNLHKSLTSSTGSTN